MIRCDNRSGCPLAGAHDVGSVTKTPGTAPLRRSSLNAESAHV
jgi:hypothetical protein